MPLSKEFYLDEIKSKYPNSYNESLKDLPIKDLEDMLDFLESALSKADGGSIGIEVLFGPKRGEYQTGGPAYDSRATAQDFANALKNVSAGTTYQQQADAQRYARNRANEMLTEAFRSGNINQLAKTFNFQNDPSLRFEKNRSGIYGLTQANRENVLRNMTQQMLSYPTGGGSSAPPKKSPLQLKIEENKRIYDEYIKNNPPALGVITGPKGGAPTPPKPEYEDQALLSKLTMLTPEEALSGETFDTLSDLDQYNFAQAYTQFQPQLRDPTYVSPYGLDPRATFGRRYGIKDGGRVGLFMGGPALEGQALAIYNSMNAYGFTDQQIADALEARGLNTSGSTTPDAPITIQPIGYQGRGDDNPYAGQVVDQTDYSFNKKNYAPGEKLEINPAAVGMSFYDSTRGTSKPSTAVKEDKGFIGKTIDSFMGAAIPEKQLSQFTSPTTGGTLTGPAEFGFMAQNIEGIPGNLTREDLRGMYDNYNKFLGRPSNFANARIKGPAGNLINLVPVIGSAARMFGSQGDKSLPSKYTVDGAGFGNTGARDEFGLGTFDVKDGFLGLTGNTTRNYVDRMQDKLEDLKDFFGSRIDDFDINNLDPATLSKMKGINSFYTKQIQAYQQRLATEKLNEQAKREQAAAEIKARQADTTRRARELNPDVYAKAEELGFIDKNTGGFKSTGTNENFSNKTGKGRTGYSEGGLATMFKRKR